MGRTLSKQRMRKVKRSNGAHAPSVDKEVPVDGIKNGTIITSLKGDMAEDTIKVGGKTVETIHAVLSADRRSITATVDGTDRRAVPYIV